MFFTLLKELVDRFIEFLLKMSKGESPEAKLTSVLKSTVFLLSVLIFVSISLLAENINLRTQLSDYKSVAAKVGLLLNPESSSVAAEEVSRLTASIEGSNAALRKENNQLSETNASLTQENYWIQVLLQKTLQDISRLKANNDTLLKICKVPKS